MELCQGQLLLQEFSRLLGAALGIPDHVRDVAASEAIRADTTCTFANRVQTRIPAGFKVPSPDRWCSTFEAQPCDGRPQPAQLRLGGAVIKLILAHRGARW